MPEPYRSEDFDRAGFRPSVIGLLKNLIADATELFRTEAEVVRRELQESTRAMLVDGVRVMAYAGLALLGVLSLLAFLIIALGDLITGGAHPVTAFWLSTLFVGLVFTIAGGILAYSNAKRLGEDMALPKTKTELRSDRQFVRQEIRKLKEAGRP